MSRRKRCVGCVERAPAETRQVRVYARRKQWLFNTVLCNTCWYGMFDVLRNSSEGVTEGLWQPTTEDRHR